MPVIKRQQMHKTHRHAIADVAVNNSVYIQGGPKK